MKNIRLEKLLNTPPYKLTYEDKIVLKYNSYFKHNYFIKYKLYFYGSNPIPN